MPGSFCPNRTIFLLLCAQWYVPVYRRNVCGNRATGTSSYYCKYLLNPGFCRRMYCRLLVWMGNRPVALQEKRFKILPAEIPESCRLFLYKIWKICLNPWNVISYYEDLCTHRRRNCKNEF